ncbi:two-component regulator propeller domain-containing protein [Flavicella sp.]|uniref:type IX secretion system anionic LPS delivery protein PorZ n=1 Tax=Flavicella sp. TaxID=2957742 RepID=UPI003019ED25
MKCLLKILVFLFALNIYAQVDYSSKWNDFYSYTNIVDFVEESNIIYAITENAVFTFDTQSGEVQKISSVNGLSGNQTSSIYYHKTLQLLIVGYEDGLLEIIDKDGEVKIVVDIRLSEISTETQINSIYGFENKIYLALGFGIVVYDLINFQFDDTYFIGQNSTEVKILEILVFDDDIFASTDDGVYIASMTDNLADSNNWVKNFSGDFLSIMSFQNQVITTEGNNIYKILNNSILELKASLPNSVVSISSYEETFAAITSNQAFLYDSNFDLKVSSNSTTTDLNSIEIDNQSFYLGSDEFGVLTSEFIEPNNFEKIYPDGPISNELFSITVSNGNLWTAYGGINTGFAPLGYSKGISHFNGEKWINIAFGVENVGVSVSRDLLYVTVDPENKEKIYVSSYAQKYGDVDSHDGGGILVIENDMFYDFWNAVNTNLGTNSGLKNYTSETSGYTTTRIYGTSFDDIGNLWVINSFVTDGSGALKKKSINGVWSDHHLSIDDSEFTVLKIDGFGNIWMGSRNIGMSVYNEKDNKKTLLTSDYDGLPNDNVRAIAIGMDNNIWVGTLQGLVLFSDVENVFSGSFQSAEPVIIDSDDGASILLDGMQINDIKVDGAGNLWFATATGGVLQTNSTGKTTLNRFNTDNSPLPTNNVLSIGIDHSSGRVYFGTFDGIVAFDAGVLSYGEDLSEVYAYPNPSLKNNDQINIVGKNSNLPEDTNIKILDVAGNLVFESNASENQSSYGGRFVWDKRNLAGRKVASGIYIVLLFNVEGKQTSSTKIAIIN